MANEFVTRTGLIVSGSTYLPAATSASKGYILSFDTSTKEVYYMSTSSVTVTVPGSNTQVIYNNNGSFGAASNFVFSGSNVGIGTTSPLTLLDLRASSNTSITPLASVPDTSTTLLIGNTGTNGVLALGHDNAGHPWLQGRSVLANQSAEDILINPLGGNVGIGTTSPTAKLHVSSTGETTLVIDSTSSGTARINLTGAGGGAGSITSTVGGLYLNASGNNPLTFNTSGSERMRVAGDGNVGIGTTSPSSLLHVSGTTPTVTIEGSSTNSAKIDLVGPYTTWTLENQYINGATNDMFRIYNSQLGANAITINRLSNNVGIGTTSPSQKLEVSGSGYIIKASATGSDSSYFQAVNGSYDYIAGIATSLGYGLMGMNSNHALAIMTSGSERMRISSAGNVGIGINNPNYKLVVYESNTGESVSARFETTHPNLNYILLKNGGGSYNHYLQTNSNTLALSADENGSTGIINLKTNNITGLTINSSQNVGIGKTSPSTKLDVSGSVLISGSLTVSGSSTFTNIGPAVFTGSITQNASTASFGGLVGIGTSSPGSKLEIRGAQSATKSSLLLLSKFDYGTTTFFQNYSNTFYSNGKSLEIEVETLPMLQLATNNGATEGKAIFPNGNVGIGTTSPSRKLIVYDTDANVPTIGLRTDGSGTTTGDGFDLQFASNNTFLFNRESGYMSFGTDNTERVRIAATGDTHIGTTAYAGIGGSGYLMVKNVIGLVPDNTASTNNRNWAIQANGQFSGSLDFVTSAASASFPNDAYRVSFTRTGGVVASSFTGSFSGSVSAPGSTTQIVYNSGGALAADSGLVYSGSRVGIGTANPSQSLSVNGAIESLGDGFSEGGQLILRGTTYRYNVDNYNGQALRFFREDDATLSGGTVLMYVSASGNIGIGTTAPGAKLDIVSTGAGSEGLRVDGSGGGFAFVVKAGSDYTSHIRAGATVGVNYFTTPPSNGLIVEGNVGIGTTSPSAKLHVSGASATIRIDDTAAGNPGFEIMSGGSTQASLISNTSTGNTTLLVPAGSLTLRAAVGNVFITGSTFQTGSGTITGDLTVGGTITAQKLNVQQITSSVVYSSGSNIFGNSLSNTQTFTGSIQATGSSHYFLGNVGIGTTSPTDSALEVNGNIGYTGDANRYFFFPDVYQGTGSLTLQAGFGSALAGGAIQIFGHNTPTNSGSVAIGLSNVGDFKVQNYLGDSTKFIVQYTGNVGIGTTSPASKLQIGSVGSTGYSVGNGLALGDGTRAGALNVESGGTNLYSSTNLIFSPGTTEAVRITSAGDVGIGTSSPISGQGTPLTLASSTGYVGLTLSGSGAYSHLWQLYASGDGGSNKFFGIYDNTNATYRLVTTSGGNVGIGTTSPSNKLYVSATVEDYVAVIENLGTGTAKNGLWIKTDSSFTNSTVLKVTGTTSDSETLQVNPGQVRIGPGSIGQFDGTLFLTSSAATVANFVANNSSALFISGSGNVGIGISSPTYKLNVVTNAVAGRQNLAAIDRTSGNLITFTNPQYSTDASMGLMLRIFPQSDARQGAGIIASGGSNNGATDLSLWTSFSSDGLASTSSADLTINGVTKYVGIGTTSPDAKLTISGSGVDLATFYNNNTKNLTITSAGNLSFNTNTSLGLLWSPASLKFEGQTQGITARPYDPSYVTFTVAGASSQTANLQEWQSSGGSVYSVVNATGNFGIGNSSPNFPLHVGNGSSSEQIMIQSDGGGATLRFYDSVNDSGGNRYQMIGHLDTTSKLQFSATSSGLIAMSINPDGRIGMGTTNPAHKLDVIGNARIGQNSNSSTNASIDLTSGGSGYNAFIDYGYYDTFDASIWRAGVFGDDSSKFKIQNTGAGPVYDVFTISGTSTFAFLTGSVGIGTTSPGAKLQITGGTLDGASLTDLGISSGLTTGRLGTFDANSLASISTRGDASSVELAAGSSATYYTGISATANNATSFTGTLRFFTSGSEKVRITPSGNVGIGKDNPVYTLDVNGSFRVDGTNGDFIVASTGNDIYFTRNDANYFYANQANSSINFLLGAGLSQSLHLKNNGNVGINNVSPTAKLDVTGNSKFVAGFSSYTTDGLFSADALPGVHVSTPGGVGRGTYIGYRDFGGGQYWGRIGVSGSVAWSLGIGNSAGTDFSIGLNNGTATDYLTILSGSGYVGIGTASPTEKLHIYGTSNQVVKIENSGTYLMYLGLVSNEGFIGSTNATPLTFYTNNVNRMYITTDGNVGIGTANPNTKLDVSGSISLAGTDGLRIGFVGDNSAYDNVKLYYSGYNGGAPRVYLTPRTTPGSGVVQTYFHLLNSNGASTTSNNTMGLLVDGNVGINTTSPSYNLHVSGTIAIQAQGTTTIESTTFSGSLTTNTNIASVPTASFKAAFFDYYVASGSVNMRAGTVMAVHNNSTSRYTDTSTADIGTTAPVDFSTSIVAGSLVLTANISSGTWEIKTAYRAL